MHYNLLLFAQFLIKKQKEWRPIRSPFFLNLKDKINSGTRCFLAQFLLIFPGLLPRIVAVLLHINSGE